MPIEKFNKENGYPKGSYLEILSNKKMNIEDDKLLTTNSKDDIISGYASLIKPLQYMLIMISVFSFVIALIIIYIVTSLLIEENKNTISMLKVFGYRKREIHNLILKSNTILVVVGYLISIPILLYSMEGFFKEITKEMNITIPSKLNNINILIGFIIIFFAYNVAKFFNKRKIEQISLTDTLKLKAE
ncbi:hypothetical protein SH2C18_24580 [Clostridium sediminicola]|uniref:FtsX-like permease family protein n=1 Tax=Clostridium sediminicola TaxID=3114879 RepID=UPI0031F218ED